MARASLWLRVAAALWQSGVGQLWPWQWPYVAWAYWRWGPTHATLAAVAALRAPHRAAIVDEQGVLTFAELVAQASNLAQQIRQLHGLCEGQTAALLCHNHRGFVVGLVALGQLGMDCLVLGCETPPAVLMAIAERARPRLVLHDSALAELATQAFSALARVDVAMVGAAAQATPLPRLDHKSRVVVLTSGTTGVAKGIARRPSLGQVLPTATALLVALPLTLHRPLLLAIPLYHGYGLTTLAVALALAAPLHLAPRPDIAALLARVGAGPAPIVVSIPTLLQRWLRRRDTQTPPVLAAVVTGSAPLPPPLCQQLLLACGPVLFNLYGSTESGILAMATPQDLAASPGTVGKPLPGTPVQLRDATGNVPPTGQPGAVWAKGPLVLGGDAQGWAATGDIGRFDALGRLFVCGRSDAMVVSGGENVYPHELEEALLGHSDVVEVAVRGVADPEFGQRLEAWVVLRAAGAVSVADLQLWLASRIERFKRPRQLHFVAALPRNALGKVVAGELDKLA